MKRILILTLALMLALPASIAEEALPPVITEPVELTEPAAEKQESITVSFIGDCSIGDSVQWRNSKNSYHNVLKAEGYAWPFSLVKDVLAADDLTVANLEVVFTTKSKPRSNKEINLIGDPAFVQVLHEGSIEVVNTANNHAWDFNADAYHEMLGYLNEAQIEHFGTLYPYQKTGSDVYITVDVKGVTFGFLGFSYPQEADKKRIANRIQTLREQGADVVVLSLHWGREEQPQPQSGAANFAKYCIDAGADMIYGQHPHVLQSVQFYNGKPIFYSTGNFTFGSMSHVDPDTGIFQLTWDLSDEGPMLRRFEVIPCRTQGSGDYRPYILTDEYEITRMRKKLVHKRKVKNMTTVTDFFIENGYMEFENGMAVGE